MTKTHRLHDKIKTGLDVFSFIEKNTFAQQAISRIAFQTMLNAAEPLVDRKVAECIDKHINTAKNSQRIREEVVECIHNSQSVRDTIREIVDDAVEEAVEDECDRRDNANERIKLCMLDDELETEFCKDRCSRCVHNRVNVETLRERISA